MSAIINKIRKLLAVTLENGATVGEVENAVKMAQILMAKHQIESGSISINKDDIIEEHFLDIKVSYERSGWIWDLLEIIGGSHNCQIIRFKTLDTSTPNWKMKKVYRIIGFPEDVETVSELCKSLVPIIRAIARKKALPHKNRREFHVSYVDGFLLGLQTKLNASKKQKFELTDEEHSQYQLIIVKKTDLISDYVEEKIKPRMIETKQAKVDSRAYYDGYQDGKDFNELNKRLN